MKIHHLNCGTMNIPMALPRQRTPDHAVCHCLLIETGDGLILVDSGIGTEDIRDPSRLGPMHYLLPIRRDPAGTALHQIQIMGYDARDVRHILITHLDLDHTGGIPDFPNATVHVLREEYQASLAPSGFRERHRYRKAHLSRAKRWETYDETLGESWLGFPCIRSLRGIPEGIVLVPLKGHTRGHCGVAIEIPEGWLLHAGDAYYSKLDMSPTPVCPLIFRLFERFVHLDHTGAMSMKRRLWELVNQSGHNLTVFCAHDPAELKRFTALSQG
jgi:glyoxylase-like metal-dependent hydrolase (beta-lactamase superfamily II)